MIKFSLSKQLSLLFFIGGLSFQSFGQAKISFMDETHDFGEIEEEDGYAEHTFTFINEGDKPITISRVKASCGCTTPGWTKEQVMPGDSGFVKARYNPRNRPGKFRKSLRLTTTEASQNKVLYISGFVKPKPRSLKDEYTIGAGDLRLKYRSMNLGKITTEKTVKKSFDVYNAGQDSIELQQALMRIPDHIQLAMVPYRLAPGAKGELIVTYDPVAKDDLGFISDNITIQTDSVVTIRNEFYVLATIEEFFPLMTPEKLDKSPKLSIDERVYDFGRVKAGEVVAIAFELKNSGKEKLNLRKIKSNCSCVTYEIASSNIKKGKSLSLRVLFDTTDRRGNQYKTITIFSNDPTGPTQMITLKGVVDKVEDEQ